MNASTSTGETPSLASIEFFIRRWKGSGGSEIGNAQPCISQLCTDVLGVEPPEPASACVEKNTYVFERRVTFTNGKDQSTGRIDCYKRGHFVLEAKQGSDVPEETEGEALGVESPTRKTGTARRGTRTWQRAMKRAKEQAHRYARALPLSQVDPREYISAHWGSPLWRPVGRQIQWLRKKRKNLEGQVRDRHSSNW